MHCTWEKCNFADIIEINLASIKVMNYNRRALCTYPRAVQGRRLNCHGCHNIPCLFVQASASRRHKGPALIRQMCRRREDPAMRRKLHVHYLYPANSLRSLWKVFAILCWFYGSLQLRTWFRLLECTFLKTLFVFWPKATILKFIDLLSGFWFMWSCPWHKMAW